ncbi:MAG: hypothetical protein L0Y57_00640 [Beijerinckiaceae bacterium]|nr:hypothetical protein [Beijerinckiaceae bacterium]
MRFVLQTNGPACLGIDENIDHMSIMTQETQRIVEIVTLAVKLDTYWLRLQPAGGAAHPLQRLE